MSSFVVPFSMLLAMGQGPVRPPLNDNHPDRECAHFFEMTAPAPLRLTQSDAEVVFDAGREDSLRLAQAHRAALGSNGNPFETLEAEVAINALLDAAPRLALSPRGHYLTQADRDATPFVHALSPDGSYLVHTSFAGDHQELVDARSGEVHLNRQIANEPQGHNGVSMIFSGRGDAMSVRVRDRVELVTLGPRPRVTASYDLGPVNVTREYEADADGPRWRVGADARGEVHYLPRARALVTFFEVLAPVVLRLGPNGSYRPLDLAPAPSTDYVPVAYAPDLDPHVRAASKFHDEPKYHARGLVAPSEETLVAVRMQYREAQTQSFVEIYRVEDGAFVRAFKIPGIVSALALSPNERRLAVASPDRGGVRVFDLDDASAEPRVVIEMNAYDGRLLAFGRDDELLVGSDEISRLLRFELGEFGR